MLKVLHVLWSGHVGGIERVVYNLARAQRQQGLQVTLLMGQGGGEFYDRSGKVGIPVVSLGLRSGFSFLPTALLQAYRLVKQADIVHYHAFLPITAVAGILTRRRLLYSDHGHDITKPALPFPKRLKKGLQVLFIRHAVHLVVANSHHTRQLGSQVFGIPLARIRVVHNGIDVNEIRPFESKSQTRSALNIPSEAVVIGTVCRLATFKRVDRLLESFSLLPPLAHHRLLIVGDGPAAPALAEQAKILNIQDKVIFTGFRSDIGNLLQAMDLFVLPSQGEPFGIAILEALAIGLPVFVFADAGGAIELIGESSTITTPFEMAQALAQQTPSAPHQPLEYFRIERMADQFLQLYKEIAHA